MSTKIALPNYTPGEILRLKDAALAAASCGIVITDFTLEDNPIIYCNDAFVDLTGYDRDYIIGRNCRFLQHPGEDATDLIDDSEDLNSEALDEIRSALAEHRSCRVVLKNYRRDGEVFWNDLIISPVEDDSGKVVSYIGVQTDITGRIQDRQNPEPNSADIQEIISKILSERDNKQERIAVKDNQERSIRFINPRDIIYIESKDRKVHIHTAEDSFSSYHTIKKLSEKLAQYNFQRANQSTLINIAFVEHMVAHGDGSYDLILKEPKSETITASRLYSKQILDSLSL